MWQLFFWDMVSRLVGFLGDLTNWYVRLNRSRLKGNDGEDSALTSLSVLFEVLLKMTILMSPFTPFFTEYLYQRLRARLPTFNNQSVSPDVIGKADSIHYVMLPTEDGPVPDEKILIGMRTLQKAVELGRRAREAVNISMRMPVREVLIVCSDTGSLASLKDHLKDYLLDELNAWGGILTSDVEKWCSVTALPNLPVLAKRLGKRMRAATTAIKSLGSDMLREYQEKGKISVNVDGTPLQLVAGELVVRSTFAGDTGQYSAITSSDGGLTVAICTVQDDTLRMQAVVRDLCNRVNKLRKKAKLNITDAVDVFYADLKPVDLCQSPHQSSTFISTARALACNASLLEKANIVPMPLRKCHGQIIISDINSTLFGTSCLKIALAMPVPCTPTASKAQYKDSGVLDILLASCCLPGRDLRGSLAANSFELKTGVHLFSGATAAHKKC